MRESIVVVHSFKSFGGMACDRGKTYWFPDEESANEYLEKAGTSFTLGGVEMYHDDPCEHFWDSVVVERVTPGHSCNQVLSWWEAEYSNGRLKRMVRVDPPEWADGRINFCGVG